MKTYSKLSSKIALATLLLGCLAGWSATATADDVTAIWSTKCASCHGKDGKGNTTMGRKLEIKDLTDPKVQASFDDAKATSSIKDGITVDGTEKMKAFSSKLSDDQIKALVGYVRTLK